MKDYLTKRDPNLEALIARYEEPTHTEESMTGLDKPMATQTTNARHTRVKAGEVIYRLWMLFLAIFIVGSMFNAATTNRGGNKLNCKDPRNEHECELRAFESRNRL